MKFYFQFPSSKIRIMRSNRCRSLQTANITIIIKELENETERSNVRLQNTSAES